jgi:putative transposase
LFTDRDRVVLGVLSQVLDRAHLGEVFLIVRPETVLGWHRRLVARHWAQPARRPGRPSTALEVRRLVLRLDRENPTLGLPAHPRRACPARPQGGCVDGVEDLA